MNKEWLEILARRFLKGLIAAVGAFAVQFLATQLPEIGEHLGQYSFFAIPIITALLLALEKSLQGYNP